MKLPPLTDQELAPFLREGVWVAKLATHNPDGSMRITPLTYALGDDGEILFSTWQNSDAARNLRRDPRSSVLIDKVDAPYAGVHYIGQAEVEPETCTPEEYAQRFGRYVGDSTQAAEGYRALTELGLGERACIRFRPMETVTWDFAKLPGD
jgi:PPOX class probable F420-dependent enzyme